MSMKTLLIIDDDHDLILGLSVRLKANGYRVVAALDAISAVEVARRESPDLIILDLGLPAGDGFVVIERLRSLPDLMAIPIIILSARDPTDNKMRALDAGAVAFFHKPPDNQELLSAIQQAVGESPALSTFLKT
jgi:two-component system KDP operon response regulator KdpE